MTEGKDNQAEIFVNGALTTDAQRILLEIGNLSLDKDHIYPGNIAKRVEGSKEKVIKICKMLAAAGFLTRNEEGCGKRFSRLKEIKTITLTKKGVEEIEKIKRDPPISSFIMALEYFIAYLRRQRQF